MPTADAIASSALPDICHRAADDLAVLAGQLEARGRSAAATGAHLARLQSHQRRCDRGAYRVFRIAATRQFVVLRDIDALTEATCVHECSAFADALAWANRQLAAEFAAPPA